MALPAIVRARVRLHSIYTTHQQQQQNRKHPTRWSGQRDDVIAVACCPHQQQTHTTPKKTLRRVAHDRVRYCSATRITCSPRCRQWTPLAIQCEHDILPRSSCSRRSSAGVPGAGVQPQPQNDDNHCSIEWGVWLLFVGTRIIELVYNRLA